MKKNTQEVKQIQCLSTTKNNDKLLYNLQRNDNRLHQCTESRDAFDVKCAGCRLHPKELCTSKVDANSVGLMSSASNARSNRVVKNSYQWYKQRLKPILWPSKYENSKGHIYPNQYEPPFRRKLELSSFKKCKHHYRSYINCVFSECKLQYGNKTGQQSNKSEPMSSIMSKTPDCEPSVTTLFKNSNQRELLYKMENIPNGLQPPQFRGKNIYPLFSSAIIQVGEALRFIFMIFHLILFLISIPPCWGELTEEQLLHFKRERVEAAEKWAPLILFHPDERYFPSDVHSFLQNVIPKNIPANERTPEPPVIVSVSRSLDIQSLPEGVESEDTYLIAPIDENCKNCPLPNFLHGNKPSAEYSPPAYAVITSCLPSKAQYIRRSRNTEPPAKQMRRRRFRLKRRRKKLSFKDRLKLFRRRRTSLPFEGDNYSDPDPLNSFTSFEEYDTLEDGKVYSVNREHEFKDAVAKLPSTTLLPPKEKLGTLQPEQLGTLQPEKLGTLHPEKLGTLHPEKLATLHPEKLGTLQPEKLATLHPEKLGTLHPEKLATLHPEKQDARPNMTEKLDNFQSESILTTSVPQTTLRSDINETDVKHPSTELSHDEKVTTPQPDSEIDGEKTLQYGESTLTEVILDLNSTNANSSEAYSYVIVKDKYSDNNLTTNDNSSLDLDATASRIRKEKEGSKKTPSTSQENETKENDIPEGNIEVNNNHRFTVTYWMFYPYSQGKQVCTSRLWIVGRVFKPRLRNKCYGDLITLNSHVGDWEHVSIYFEDDLPRRMYVSTHTYGAYYNYDPNDNVFVYKGKDTRLGLPLNPKYPPIIKMDGTHPVLYAAMGSHGLWGSPGVHRYENLVPLEDKTMAGTPWKSWKNIDIIDYRDPDHFRPDRQWLKFYGRWGNPSSGCHRALFGTCDLASGPTGIPLKRENFPCHLPDHPTFFPEI